MVNVIERPDGVKIAGFFIGSIVVVSLASRLYRTLELRVERIELDEAARVEGASALQVLWKVYVPSHVPSISPTAWCR